MSIPQRWRILPTALLVVLAACGADDPGPRRVKARLETVLGLAPKTPKPDEIRDALVRQLRTAAAPSKETIDGFYARHASDLVWSDASGKQIPSTRVLIEALKHAGDHGLVPEDYAVARLESLEKEMVQGDAATRADRLADFDLLATAAFFRYASDLSTGRVHPNEVEEGWHTQASEIDLDKALDDALASDAMPKLLESLPPPHPGYARLRQALVKLRETETAGGWPTIPPGPKMKTGSRDPRVTLLRQRLGVAPGDGFDAALSAAVKAAQSTYGIEPDGVVSDATLAELNVPAGERVRQVELNLERWRWAPRNFGDTYILVNIPGFDLELDQGNALAWRTRVVAGKAFTPTPVFSDKVVGIVANPPWNVPTSIAVNEYLPELRKNSDALERKGLRLFEGEGDKEREVNARRVDWDKLDTDHFPYHIRQEPGAENPLGRVKFDLTNDFSIYLHDTPGRGAFLKSGRDLSHGCIRVQNAVELAHRITDGETRAKLDEALEQPEERRVPLASKIPVHILYWTAWVDENGEIHFGPDIYGFDKSQRAALDRVSGHGGPAV